MRARIHRACLSPRPSSLYIVVPTDGKGNHLFRTKIVTDLLESMIFGQSAHRAPGVRVSGSVGQGRRDQHNRNRGPGSPGYGGGVTIYVLGLIGLAIPIRNITHDMSTARYAVSVVPKTMVAGQGLRIWLQRPIAVTAVLVLMLLGAQRLGVGPSYRRLFVAVLLLLGANLIRRLAGTNPELGKLSNAIIYVSLLVGGGIANLAALSFASGEDDYISGILIVLFGSFFIGVPPAILADPPLPKVQLTQQHKASIEGVPDPLVGWLVVHREGCLLVLAKEQRKLLSIPADKLLVVQMPAEDAVAKEAEKPSCEETN
jgi:hypothetical protein